MRKAVLFIGIMVAIFVGEISSVQCSVRRPNGGSNPTARHWRGGAPVASRMLPIELKKTPIQAQLQQHLTAFTSNVFNDFDTQKLSKTGDEFGRESNEHKKKSAVKAAIYSAILPGWGEYYLGHKKKARVFFTAEALSWIGFAAFTTYGKWKKDDFIRFANERAGADLWGKDDDFLDLVGFYDNVDEYNSFGRVFDPDRPYLEDNASNHWRWQSSGDRASYRHLKNQSREAYRRADFMIGLAVLNRVVSIIDAIRDAKRSQRALDSSFSIEIDPFSVNRQITLTLFTSF